MLSLTLNQTTKRRGRGEQQHGMARGGREVGIQQQQRTQQVHHFQQEGGGMARGGWSVGQSEQTQQQEEMSD